MWIESLLFLTSSCPPRLAALRRGRIKVRNAAMASNWGFSTPHSSRVSLELLVERASTIWVSTRSPCCASLNKPQSSVLKIPSRH